MDTLFSFVSTPLGIAMATLSIVVVILVALVIRMHLKLRRFLVDVEAASIADSLEHVSGSLTDLQRFRNELESYLSSVETRLRKSVQAVHTVRFNPFKGTGGGGNQSFATTILAEDGDGVIISSLYSRDHVSVFAKPLRDHACEHELSGEERESLDRALNKLQGSDTNETDRI